MKVKKFAALLLIAVLFTSLPSYAFAKDPVKKDVDYVALGDSLAAGVTPYNTIDFGYADFLLKRLEQSQYTVDFDNFAVPGHTSSDLIGVLSKEQVQEKIKEAEFITLDIGANDLLSVLTDPTKVPGTINKVAINLQAALSTIDSLNPNAKVYILGYYNPFPNAPAEQQPNLEALLNSLNQVIQYSANVNGDTYVPTEDIIAKNYNTYLPNPANIHLSLEGYQIIAKEVWKKLDKSKND